MYKIYDVKYKNKNGYGNTLGDHLFTFYEIEQEELKKLMILNNLNQVYVLDLKSQTVNTFYIEEL